MKSRVRDTLWALWMPLADRAARGYVAGPELGDAMHACDLFARQGWAVTLCHWSPPGYAPAQVAGSYLAAIAALRGTEWDWYPSIKAPELGFSRKLVIEAADAARTAGVRLHFDAHGPEVADQTFDLIAAARAHHPLVGCTLPGRWRRSPGDAERAAAMGLAVRVVKGQWKDPEEPGRDLRKGFLEVVERLAGRARRVAVASHDPVTVRASVERLRASGTPCEVELLFGLPARPALAEASELGVPVRIYVPYGRGWLPYCFTQMAKNPRILWWLLRDMVAHSGPLSQDRRALPGKEASTR